MTSLDDFREGGGKAPPEVKKKHRVKPDWADKSIGVLGLGLNREGYVYVSERDRDEHLFHKLTAYAVSVRLLPYLERRSVYTICIKEGGTGDVYEYGIRQFTEADHHIDFGDKQAAVPTDKAKHCWEDLGSDIWNLTG